MPVLASVATAIAPTIAVEAGAVEPVASAVCVLDTVVIAHRLVPAAGAGPPFRLDALGPGGAGDAAAHPPPDEEQRRAVRHLGHHLHRLGPVEQAEGPLRSLGRRGRFGCIGGRFGLFEPRHRLPAGRHRLLRPLRPVAGDRLQTADGAFAQLCQQAIDQQVHVAPPPLIPGERKLRGRERLDALGVERREIDAEAGVDGLQRLPEETQQVIAVPRRARRGDRAPDHAAVDPVAPERKPPHAEPVPLQGCSQPRHEPGQRRVEPRPVDQGLRQGQALQAGGRRGHGHDRLGLPAQRPVEAREHRAPPLPAGEAAGERRARQTLHRADRDEP